MKVDWNRLEREIGVTFGVGLAASGAYAGYNNDPLFAVIALAASFFAFHNSKVLKP